MLCPLLVLLAIFAGARCSELAMVDQLQQRLLSTNASGNLLTKDYLESKFPFLKSDCVKDALSRFLPICLKEGIESVETELRVETAVKLSICEFKASGLEHIPNSCESKAIDSMMDCMIQLESSAQWWTTYSGNYQRLTTICFENSLPYEKDQILALFLNITNTYTDLSDQLNEQLYQIISNSEFASREHMQKMASMFQDYMSRFTEESKSHKSVIEDDIRAHRNQVNELIINNSANFEQELSKRNFELTNNVREVLDIIGMIKSSLQHLDISNEINEINKQAMSDWKRVDEVAESVLKSQHDGQEQLSEQWDEFLSSTRKNMSVMSTELIESQNHAIKVLGSYDEMMKHYMVTTLSEEMFPELQALQQQILMDWKQTTDFIAEDLAYWNREVSSSFESISHNLSRTMETVNDLDQRITRFQNIFAKMQKAMEMGWKLFQYNLSILKYLLVHRLFWALALITFFWPRLLGVMPSKRIALGFMRYAQAIAKWMVLLLAILIGSRLGSLIVSTD